MDQCNASRKSLRTNFRNDYKLMLDPLCHNKPGLFNSKKIVDTSSPDQPRVKLEQIDEKSEIQEYLNSSFVKKKAKYTKYSPIKVATNSISEINESTTTIDPSNRISCASDQDIVFDNERNNPVLSSKKILSKSYTDSPIPGTPPQLSNTMSPQTAVSKTSSKEKTRSSKMKISTISCNDSPIPGTPPQSSNTMSPQTAVSKTSSKEKTRSSTMKTSTISCNDSPIPGTPPQLSNSMSPQTAVSKSSSREKLTRSSKMKTPTISFNDSPIPGTPPQLSNSMFPQTAVSKTLSREKITRSSKMKTPTNSCNDSTIPGTPPKLNNMSPQTAVSKTSSKEKTAKSPSKMKTSTISYSPIPGTPPQLSNIMSPQTAVSKTSSKEKTTRSSTMKTSTISCTDSPIPGTPPHLSNTMSPQTGVSKTSSKEKITRPSKMKTPTISCNVTSEKLPTNPPNNQNDAIMIGHSSNHNVRNSIRSDQLWNPPLERKKINSSEIKKINSSHIAQNDGFEEPETVVSKSKISAKATRASDSLFLDEKIPQLILKNISPQITLRKENGCSNETSCELPKAIPKQKKTNPQKKSRPSPSFVDEQKEELSKPNMCSKSSPQPNSLPNEVNLKNDCERLSKPSHSNKSKQYSQSKSSNSINSKSKNSIPKGSIPENLKVAESNTYNSPPHQKNKRKSFFKEISSISTEPEEIELNHYELESDMPLLSAQEKVITKNTELECKSVDLENANTKHLGSESKREGLDKAVTRLSKPSHSNKSKQYSQSKSSNSINSKSKNSIPKGSIPENLKVAESNTYNSPPHQKNKRKSFFKEISSISTEPEEIELNHYELESDMPLLSAQEKVITKNTELECKSVDLENANTKHLGSESKREGLDKAVTRHPESEPKRNLVKTDTKHPESEHKRVDLNKNIEKTCLPRKRGRGRKKRRLSESKVMEIEGDDDLLTEPESPQKDGKQSQKRTGKRFSVTGNWYIAAGFLNDIIALLEEFDSVDGWRFADFAQCWKKKSFSHIYRGRQTFKELLEFSEEITLLTKRFLSPPHSFKRRVGALYTLYGLYHKFPLGQNNFFFLRFELDEYKMLLELIQPFRSSPENPDPAFIFRKLELEGAILHCVSACEPCYDFYNEEREGVELEYGKQRLAKSSAVSNALPKQQLMADDDIIRHYHSMKTKLAGDEESKPDKVLSMISPEFVSSISTTLVRLKQEILIELGMLEDTSCSNTTEAVDRSLNKKKTGSKACANVNEMVEAINKSSTAAFSRHVMKQHEIAKSSDVQDFMAHPITQAIIKQPLRIRAESKREGHVPRRKGRTPKLKQKKPATEESAPIPETELNDGRVMLDVNSEPPTNQELKQALLPQPMPPKKKRGRKRVLALRKAASFSPRRPVPPRKIEEEADKGEFSPANSQAPVDVSSSATRLSSSEFARVPQHQEDPSTIVEVRLRFGDICKTVRLKVKITMEAFKTMRKNGGRYANFKKKLKPLIKETQSGQDRLKEWIVESVDLPMEDRDKDIAINNKKGKEKQQESSPKKRGFASPPKKSLSLRQKYECLKYADEDDEDLYDDQDDDDGDDDDLHKTSWKTEEEKDMDYNPPDEVPEEDALEFEVDNMRDEDEAWVTEEPTRYWRRRRGQRRSWFYSFEETIGPRDSDQLLQLRTEKSISMVPVQVDGAWRYFPMIKTKEEKKESPVPSTDDFYTWNDFSSEKEPPFKKQRRSLKEPFPYIVTPQSLRNKRNPRMDRLRTFPPPRSKTKGIKLDLPNVSCSNFIDEEEGSNECSNFIDEEDGSNECSNFIYEEGSNESSDQTIKKESEGVLKELADDWDEESYSALSSSEIHPGPNVIESIKIDHPSLDNECKVEQDFEDTFVDLEPPNPEETMSSPRSFPAELDPLFFQSPDAQVCLPSNIFGEFILSDSDALPITSVSADSPIGGDEKTFFQSKDDTNVCNIVQADHPNALSLPPVTVVPMIPQLHTVDNPVCPETVSGLPSVNEVSTATPLIGSQHCPSSLYEFEEVNQSKVLYYKVLTPDGNNIFLPACSLPDLEPKKIEILSFDVADVKPVFPVNESPAAKNQVPCTKTTPHPVHLPQTPTSPISKPSSPPTAHRFFPQSDDTLRGGKPRCNFLFSSKLKPMMRHLPGASGEASGKPPLSEKKVKFLFKGLLKSKRSV